MEITKRDCIVYVIIFIINSLPIILYSAGAVITNLIICIVATLIVGTLVNLLIRLFMSLDMYIKSGKK